MKELEAEDARKRGGFLTSVARFFTSKHGTREWTTRFMELDEMPACPEGMMLAQAFLISVGEGVNKRDTAEPADRIIDVTARYMALVEHGEGCYSCNEV
jgi:hypothetical protein